MLSKVSKSLKNSLKLIFIDIATLTVTAVNSNCTTKRCKRLIVRHERRILETGLIKFAFIVKKISLIYTSNKKH